MAATTRSRGGEHGKPILPVLVADDEEEHVELAVAALEHHGIPARGVSQVETALALLAREPISCVIADIRMPGNENLEFVQAIARIDDTLPVLLLTAYPSFEIARRGLELAVSAYITKPFDSEDLARRTRDAIRYGVIARGVARSRLAVDDLSSQLSDVGSLLTPGTDRATRLAADQIVGASLGAVSATMRNLAEVVDACLSVPSPAHAVQPLNCPSPEALLAALREAIETLERTKNAFRSKEIAALRRNLQGVVRSFEARAFAAQRGL